MSIKFENEKTDFVVQPEDILVKSDIMGGELDQKASSLSTGVPYDSADIALWNTIQASGYSMKLSQAGFSVLHKDKVIGEAGNSNPGTPLNSHELRNMFKRSIQIAEAHQREEGSKAFRDGVAPQFLSADAFEEIAGLPSSEVSVNIHDGAPLSELKTEAVPIEANGGGDTHKSLFTEDDLIKSDYTTAGNQGRNKGE
jgi:hypothetical protein